jgi:hypothetical protein
MNFNGGITTRESTLKVEIIDNTMKTKVMSYPEQDTIKFEHPEPIMEKIGDTLFLNTDNLVIRNTDGNSMFSVLRNDV